jgi:hypothetical protein
MTRIICRVSACAFWEQGICGAEEIEYELDDGCLTFQEMIDLDLEDDEEEEDELAGWTTEGGSALFVDDDDDDWDDDDWDDEEENPLDSL